MSSSHFVGLSPELEGEEMPVKIPGFDGGDRTSIDLPEPQQEFAGGSRSNWQAGYRGFAQRQCTCTHVGEGACGRRNSGVVSRALRAERRLRVHWQV